MGTFIRPVKRVSHNSVEQGFLWQQGNVFVMHNHTHALWCWLQSGISSSKKMQLVHIDHHSDAASFMCKDEKKLAPLFTDISKIKEICVFDSYSFDSITIQNDSGGIRWDTFITVASNAKLFSKYHMFCTDTDTNYSICAGPSIYKYETIKKLFGLKEIMCSLENSVIADIDLDYFDYFVPEADADSAVEYVGEVLNANMEKVSQITIAISTSSGDGKKIRDRRIRHLKMLSKHIDINSAELCDAVNKI